VGGRAAKARKSLKDLEATGGPQYRTLWKWITGAEHSAKLQLNSLSKMKFQDKLDHACAVLKLHFPVCVRIRWEITISHCEILYKNEEAKKWVLAGLPVAGGNALQWDADGIMLMHCTDYDSDCPEQAAKWGKVVKQAFISDAVFNDLAKAEPTATKRLEDAATAFFFMQEQSCSFEGPVSRASMVAVTNAWRCLGLLASNELNAFGSGPLTLRYMAPWHAAFRNESGSTFASDFDQGSVYEDLLKSDPYWRLRVDSIAKLCGSFKRAADVDALVKEIVRSMANMGGVVKSEPGSRKYQSQIEVLLKFGKEIDAHRRQLGASRVSQLVAAAVDLSSATFKELRKVEPFPSDYIDVILQLAMTEGWEGLQQDASQASSIYVTGFIPIYVHLYIYTYACLCTFLYLHSQCLCVSACHIHTYTYIHTHTYTHPCTHTSCTHTYTHTNAQAHIHIYTHTEYTYTYTHTRTYTHIHTQIADKHVHIW